MNSIKFYSVNDLASGYNLSNIKKRFDDNAFFKPEYSLTDIIEMHNTIKYYDNNLLTPYIKTDEKEIKAKIDLMKSSIAQYLKNHDFTSLLKEVNSLPFEYIDDFWELVSAFGFYKKIDAEEFNKALNSENTILTDILECKNIVQQFDKEIKAYMLDNPFTAEFLLREYEIVPISERKKLYFPASLTLEDKEKIIDGYVSSDSPNVNYLRIIKDFQKTSELKISDMIRLNASKKAQKFDDEFFTENSGIKSCLSVIFGKDLKEVFQYSFSGLNMECKVSTNWIEENSDYCTLLNNFIYIFEFVDRQMRLSLVNKRSGMGVFERLAIMRTKRSYHHGFAFKSINMFALLKISGYYFQLAKNNIRLEEIIEWYFKEYVLENFDISNFKITMPTSDSSFFEKCKSVLPEMESILKQYNLYTMYDEIDHELLQMSSTPLPYGACKSLLERKYIYTSNDLNQKISYLFFSDQCMLHYVQRLKKTYTSFYDVITNESIKYSDYKDFCKSDLDWLMELELIKISSDEIIQINNIKKIKILRDLYENEVISYWHYPNDYKDYINAELATKSLFCENTLLSNPESDYFDFYLNKSKFNNGYDLRNKYLHGTQSMGTDDKEHETNYYIFLLLMIILVIKINDDLWLKKDNEKTTNTGEPHE